MCLRVCVCVCVHVHACACVCVPLCVHWDLLMPCRRQMGMYIGGEVEAYELSMIHSKQRGCEGSLVDRFLPPVKADSPRRDVCDAGACPPHPPLSLIPRASSARTQIAMSGVVQNT